GKPLGLGTIEMSPELGLTERKKRYENLLDQNGHWETPIVSNKSMDSLIKGFSDYMLEQLNEKKSNLWEVERLSELLKMFKFDETFNASEKWLEETRYLEIKRPIFSNGEPKINPQTKKQDIVNEFSFRKVLPTSSEVIDFFDKKQK
ncbi:MAG: hypothetical protein WBO44_15535, partial [Saprospiraceae bacterium]